MNPVEPNDTKAEPEERDPSGYLESDVRRYANVEAYEDGRWVEVDEDFDTPDDAHAFGVKQGFLAFMVIDHAVQTFAASQVGHPTWVSLPTEPVKQQVVQVGERQLPYRVHHERMKSGFRTFYDTKTNQTLSRAVYLPKGGETIVTIFDEEGETPLSEGRATCRVDENFNKRLGRTVALGRAVKALRDARDVPASRSRT